MSESQGQELKIQNFRFGSGNKILDIRLHYVDRRDIRASRMWRVHLRPANNTF